MRSRPIGNMNVDIGICEVTTGTCPLTSAWYCSNQISSFDNYNVPVTFSHFHVVNQKCPFLIVATKRSEAVYHYMNTNKTRYIYSHHYSYVLLKHFVNVSSQKKEIAYCYKVDGINMKDMIIQMGGITGFLYITVAVEHNVHVYVSPGTYECCLFSCIAHTYII